MNKTTQKPEPAERSGQAPFAGPIGSAKPRYKTCNNCDGKKWFDSAIGLVACQVCGGSGKGGIDVEWLVKDWQRLKSERDSGPFTNQLTLRDAEILAKRTDYAWDAAEQKDNPINWGDASAFFLEGWNRGMKDAIAIIKGYKPKSAKPNDQAQARRANDKL